MCSQVVIKPLLTHNELAREYCRRCYTVQHYAQPLTSQIYENVRGLAGVGFDRILILRKIAERIFSDDLKLARKNVANRSWLHRICSRGVVIR